MFSFIPFLALLSIATAAPSYTGFVQPLAVFPEPSHVEISQPVIAKVGDVVQNVPTGVTSHSSSVIHNHEQVLSPILASGIKTYTAPFVQTHVVKTGETPVLYSPDGYRYEGPTITKTAFVAEPGHVAIHEPFVTKVGDYVEHVPTAVSRQSQTIVHHDNVLTPVLAPAFQTYTAPILRTVVAPVPEIYKTYDLKPEIGYTYDHSSETGSYEEPSEKTEHNQELSTELPKDTDSTELPVYPEEGYKYDAPSKPDNKYLPSKE